MSRKLHPKDLYHSPKYVIERYNYLLQKYGQKELKKSRYKPERELLIGGWFLFGINRHQNIPYWLRCNNEDTTPDLFAARTMQTQNGASCETQCIEVMEYEKHSKCNLLEAIKEKLKNTVYPKYYILLCCIHDRMVKVNGNILCEELKQLNPNIAQIWLVGATRLNNEEVLVLKVFPEVWDTKYMLKKELKENNQIKHLRMSRDLTRKHTKIEIIPDGKIQLPLP